MPLTLTKHTLDRVPPHLPLRDQLAEHIRQAIASGDLQPGEALPGEHTIADAVGIHRDTAREAIHLLASEGLLIRANGRRTVVADPPQRTIAIPAPELDAAEEVASRRGEEVPQVVRDYLRGYVTRGQTDDS